MYSHKRVFKAILKKKDFCMCVSLSYFKLYYISITKTNKTNKTKHQTHWTQIFVHTYTSYLILDKDANNIHWRKRQHLQHMVLVKLNFSMKKKESRPLYLILYKVAFKLIKDLTIRLDCLQLLGGKVQRILQFI